MELFERIKQLRKMTGLTQELFAESLGVNRAHISKIETGSANPSDQIIKSICNVFDVNEEWLREGLGAINKKELRDEEVKKLKKELENIQYTSLHSSLDSLLGVLNGMNTALLERQKGLIKENFTTNATHPLFPMLDEKYIKIKNKAEALVNTVFLIVYNQKSK